MTGLSALVLAALAAGSAAAPAMRDLSMELVFCQPDVETYLKKGRASFSLMFTITLNEEGLPTDVSWLASTGVNRTEVEACVRKWRFPREYAGSEVEVEMRWTHGFGWEWLEIRSHGLRQRITMGASPCKYP